MPSPDNGLPSDGTAQTDAQASTATSAPEGVPSVSGGARDAVAIEASAQPEVPREPDAGEANAGASGAGDGRTDESGPKTDPSPGTGGDAGSAAGPRKRRRRRRRKGAHGAGTSPSAPVGAVAATESSEEHPPEGSEAASAPKKEVDAPQVDGGGKRSKPRKKPADKSREKREPRERPVFGVGDVVFGKILEITDDALIVDLSGKAKGIFDLAELLLPDDEPPPPKEPTSEREVGLDAPTIDPTPEGALTDATQEASEGPSNGDLPAQLNKPSSEFTGSGLVGVHSGEESKPETEPPSPNGDPPPTVNPPPTVESDGAERKHAGRRIIVAAGVRAIEGESTNPPPGATPSRPDAVATVDGDPSARNPEGLQGSAATEQNEVEVAPSASREETAAKDEAPRSKAAPYAPRVVLEIGAPFVGLVHNDGARGGLIVLTHHPRRVSQAKGVVSAALRENKTVKGLVTGLVKGGVEVDVDGLRAFTPGSHMDLRLGTDLNRFIGQRFEFSVTQYGKRGRDVVLSRKTQLEAEAKASRAVALAKLPVGSVVDGVVKTVVGFGAFVDVGGVEGLVSLSEMSHARADTPSDVFKVGDTTQVKILRIDDKGKVWLSRRAATVDPRLEALKKYATGSRHTGKVVRLQPFGAFIELEPGIDGLIHTLDLSMKHIEHPSEVVKVGESLDVVVSQVDVVNQKIALHPAPTGAASDEPSQRIQIHKPLKVVVVAVESAGLVVRVMGATGRAARGFITSAATGTPRGTELRKPFPVGTQLEAKVVEYDPKRGDLKLSIKALREDTERSAYQQYRQQVHREAKFGTFGDLLAKKGLTTNK
jgi:ribosomal protein S1